MLTGLTSDGHFVADNLLDDRGRRVTAVAVVGAPGLLEDGTQWFYIPQSSSANVSDSVSLVEAFNKSVGIVKTDTAALTEALTKAAAAAKADTVSLGESLTSQVTSGPLTVTGIAVDGSLVFSDLIDNQGRRVVAIATPGVLGMLVDGTQYVTFSEAGLPDFLKSVADTVALNESFQRAVATTKQETLSLIETLAKAVSRSSGDALGLSETERFQVQKRVQEDLGISEALTARQVRLKSFSETVGLTEVLSGGTVLPEFVETFSMTESMKAVAQKNFAEAISVNELFRRVTGKRITESIGLTENFTALAVKLKSISESVALTETLSKRVIRAVAEQVTLNENLAAVPSTGGGTQVSQSVADTVALTETLGRTAGRQTSDNVGLAEAWQMSATKVINELAGFTEDLQFRLARVLGVAEQIALTEVLQPIVVRILPTAEDLALAESLSVAVTSVGVRHVGITVFETVYLNSFVELRP